MAPTQAAKICPKGNMSGEKKNWVGEADPTYLGLRRRESRESRQAERGGES